MKYLEMEFWVMLEGIGGRLSPYSVGVFVFFGRFLGVAVKEGIEMEYWVVLKGLEIY